ncbi:MAG: alpha-L-fucosidase [Bacteroidales bacterium]|nr:alpha-L-fucosidase [Candidatus Physcousia equi]
MHKKLMLALALSASVAAHAQLEPKHVRLDNPDNAPAPVHPLPHDRQVKWMETEFYAFFHYGMDTFTGEEWGFGNTPKATYQPTEKPDPAQWLQTAKDAGMRGGIAVVKHHDGFCLWPTKTTDYCVSGDDTPAGFNVAKAFADAAKGLGMKYGFYVSPWDRSTALYGTDRYVTEMFLKQCQELTTYGNDQFEMWFDGANGGNGHYGGQAPASRSIDRATYYDVPNLRYMVHKSNPNCVLWGVGGEARWIGNEAGYAGTTNWCIDNRLEGRDQPTAASGNENGWIWLPGESDAKSSGGWFWGEKKDSYTAPNTLFKMYLETVGRNATFILNLPPAKNGKLRDQLVSNMHQLGELLRTRLGNDFATTANGATIVADETTAARTGNYAPENILDNDSTNYYATDDNTTQADITIDLGQQRSIHYVVLQEYIRLGQRVKAFKIQTSNDLQAWADFGGSVPTTTIGYKRIIPQSGDTGNYGNGVNARYVRVRILDCKSVPVISNIGVY